MSATQASRPANDQPTENDMLESIELDDHKSMKQNSHDDSEDTWLASKEDTTAIAAPAPALPPPDQGMPAIACVVGGFCVLFVSFGWITCIGVFQEYYQVNQLRDYSTSTIAWIPSLEICVMFIWGPVVGKLFDNYGPRWLLLFGSFFHVFGLMMLSLCSEYYQFILAQSICSATGASFLFFASITAVATWFQRRRALALGITVSGSSLGGVIFPIMVQRLTVEVGFGWTIRICAFLILALCIVGNLTITSRVPHKPKPLVLDDYWKPLTEWPFGLFTFGYFLFYLGFFIPYNFIILQAERYGMPHSLAIYMIPVLNTGGFFGRIAPGWAADRLGRFNVMSTFSPTSISPNPHQLINPVLTTFFAALAVLALWIPGKSNGAIIAFCILYGFGSGAFVSLTPAIIAQISPLTKLGARQGTSSFFIAVAALVSNPIGGALVPNPVVDDYWRLQVFAGMMMFGGGVAITMARVAAGGVGLRVVV